MKLFIEGTTWDVKRTNVGTKNERWIGTCRSLECVVEGLDLEDLKVAIYDVLYLLEKTEEIVTRYRR